MFCTNCGAQIEDGLNFCTNCGSPVEQPMPAPAAPAPAPAPAPQPMPAAAPMPQPAPQPVQQQSQPVMLDPLAPASVPLSQVGGETSPSICTCPNCGVKVRVNVPRANCTVNITCGKCGHKFPMQVRMD